MVFNVSVIMPVYNAEFFIEKSVTSALQFDFVKEVILIEDGSIDDLMFSYPKHPSELSGISNPTV